MKYFFALTTLFFIMESANAEPSHLSIKGSFSGTITDEINSLPLQGVSIFIADIKTGGYTNANGYFMINNISEGKHLVEISHIGYTTIAVNIIINGDVKKDFLLNTSIIENNAVIITGVTKATQLKKMPFQVSVMKKEDLLQTSTSNIIESITKKAGVSSLMTGPAISKPLIRGLGYNRVITIHDGVRQEGQQWGDEHGIEIDDASVNKIEILKGPASLIYGSDAMAGVINIITNVPLPSQTMKMNIGSNYQTNNQLRSLNGNWGGNVNGWNWNIYGTLKAAADYKNRYDGYVFNSKFNEQNAGGYAGYNSNWGFSHLLITNFNLTAGLVEGERDISGSFIKTVAGGNTEKATEADFKSIKPLIPYQHIRHFKIASDNNFKIGQSRLGLNIGWQNNRREEFGNVDKPDERALFFDLKTLTYTGQLHLMELKGWNPSIGINGMHQENLNKGIEQLIPDYQFSDIGGYIFIQRDFNKGSLSGGVRYDIRNMDVENLLDGNNIKGYEFTKTFSNFSGSIGGTLQPDKHFTYKLNVSRAFRSPSIPELASNGAHEGTSRYEYGERNLTSEISTQGDAGIEINNPHFSFNLSGYYNHFNNFIFYRKLSSAAGGDSIINVNGDIHTAFQFAQRPVHFAGLEAVLDIHPHPLDWLHLQNTFSYVSGRLQNAIESTKNLPFIPPAKLLTELRADVKKPAHFIKNFYFKFEIENILVQNKAFTAYNTETRSFGYTLLNMGIGAEFLNRNAVIRCTINFSAINILDLTYQTHLSRLKYAPQNLSNGRVGVFNQGRNFSIRINIPISIGLKK